MSGHHPWPPPARSDAEIQRTRHIAKVALLLDRAGLIPVTAEAVSIDQRRIILAEAGVPTSTPWADVVDYLEHHQARMPKAVGR